MQERNRRNGVGNHPPHLDARDGRSHIRKQIQHALMTVRRVLAERGRPAPWAPFAPPYLRLRDTSSWFIRSQCS